MAQRNLRKGEKHLINKLPIKCRWVFDVKPDGQKKARLVAKGFSQHAGTDYTDIYSPVVCFETVRLMLGLATLEKWHITGLDVRNAYLYGELNAEIYVEQPEGFTKDPNVVLRLRHAIYGLKQVGLAWWRKLDASIKDLGFERLKSEAGIFRYQKLGTNITVAVVYVDDTFFYGPDLTILNDLKQKFMKQWKCRDLGELTEFLHMYIIRRNQQILIDQADYLRTILQRF